MREGYAHDCARVRAHVSARLDGELSELEEAQLLMDVVHCASCRSSEVELSQIARLLRAAAYERPEDEIVVSGCKLTASRRLQAAAAAAAVLAGVGFVGSRALSHHRTSTPSGALASSAGSAGDSKRPAYLDSSAYEQHLIALARAVYESARRDAPVPKWG